MTNCYVLTPATVLTLTLQTSTVQAGEILYLMDTAAVAVTIADTNIRTSTGTVLTLGQYDIAVLIYTGTEWYEIALLANS